MSNEGRHRFRVTGAAYDSFMGRYSTLLAPLFADTVEADPYRTALDVGCGPGALTGVLIDRLGIDHVSACDPSPMFVEECSARHPGLDVRIGQAEKLPFADDTFDAALAQLVLHFVEDPEAAGDELRRVVRPEGSVAACVWDFEEGMEMLRAFWDAALEVDPSAPDEARTLRFGRPGEIVDLFASVGLTDTVESTLTVSSSYAGFDELWQSFLAGVGPAGAYLVAQDESRRQAIQDRLFARLGRPGGGFTMRATARTAVGRV